MTMATFEFSLIRLRQLVEVEIFRVAAVFCNLDRSDRFHRLCTGVQAEASRHHRLRPRKIPVLLFLASRKGMNQKRGQKFLRQ